LYGLSVQEKYMTIPFIPYLPNRHQAMQAPSKASFERGAASATNSVQKSVIEQAI
jgi:hypothetical protein